MADEVNGNAGEEIAGAESTPAEASPPSPAERNDASKAGNTAPPADLAREAFRRLAKGETPADVNRALFKASATTEGAAAPAEGKSPTASTATPAADKPQPDPTGDAGKWPEGMDAKELNVLKRAKMDPDTWAAIPPSNRVKILTNLKASQAAADREFGQQRQQKPGQAVKPSGASTQTDTDGQDAETLAENGAQDDDSQAVEPSTPPVKGGKKAAATPAAGGESNDLSAFLDPKDLETLDLIGGQELAGTMQRVVGRVASHYEQRQSSLLQGMEYLLNQHVGREFQSAVTDLSQQPGLDKLNEQSDAGEQLRGQLKEKALFLHRAAGDPEGYPFTEAIRDAAASLFKTNVHQTHQAALLRSRQSSLASSPERGSGRTASARPLSAAERSKAIFRNLAKGMNPNDARAAVDGS
jgi:hypothetical protein